jgi:hypothetical protein
MPRPVLAALTCWLLVAAPAAAQAPRVTGSGDPSVRNDTIYGLAVDPAKYPEEDVVYLLDDGVIRVEADGRATRTYRQVVQILTPEAAENFAERSYGWGPESEKFRLNWIRVVRPDGTVVSEGPAQQLESDVPVAMGDPVYSQRKRLRVSLANVAPGTIVDFSTTTEDTKVWLPGDFATSWSQHMAAPVRRSRFLVDAPVGMKLRLQERNLPRPRKREVRGGRQILTWGASDLEHIKPQQYATDTSSKYGSIALSGPVTWEAVGQWYGGLARDRYVLDSAGRAEVTRRLAGATTTLDTVRALHKWVAQDIRYVSVALGMGGYQPRLPAEVIRTGFGDCKDKATLFVTALRSVGIKASALLLSSFAGVEDSLPSVGSFDHVIARVELPGGKVFTDLTADFVPFGEIPRAIEGGLAVVVPPEGAVEVVHLPRSGAEAHMERTVIRATIDTAGRVGGEFILTATGTKAVGLRSPYSQAFDKTEREQIGRNIVQGIYQGAVVDTLELFNGKDLEAPVRIRVAFSQGRVLRRSGRGWILPNPVGTMEGLEESAASLERDDVRDGGRWAPIDIAQVNGPVSSVVLVEYRLPAGWTIQPPPDVVVDGPFGRYETTYTFADGVFRVQRTMSGLRGALPPARIGELLAFFREVAADNTPLITIELPAR